MAELVLRHSRQILRSQRLIAMPTGYRFREQADARGRDRSVLVDLVGRWNTVLAF